MLHSFEPGFIGSAAEALVRRNTLTLTASEQQLYLELNGVNLSSAVLEHRLG